MDSKFKYTVAGKSVFEEEIVLVHAWIGQAQSGLDLSDSLKQAKAQEVWPARLAADLEARTGHPFTPTEAYMLAVEIVERMAKLKEGFTKGLR